APPPPSGGRGFSCCAARRRSPRENSRAGHAPRGSLIRRYLSPLLSNLMLDVLDKELEKRGHSFVRYATTQHLCAQSADGRRRAGRTSNHPSTLVCSSRKSCSHSRCLPDCSAPRSPER